MPIDEQHPNSKKTPTERIAQPLEKGFARLTDPFREFIRNQTVTSAILLGATLIAIWLANSAYAHDYETFFDTHFGIVLAGWSFERSLHFWINDGLMALFFFFIGLEIKRELLVGELSKLSRTLPVVAAAIGGMLLPAGIFAIINAGSATQHGWGIPMATDTAFVIGILALLRRHVPAALTVFITALAIIDDIGAILVIALFYTDTVSGVHLSYALGALVLMLMLNLLGIKRLTPYLLTGGLLWLAMLESGIHATVAGILAAVAVPARPKHDTGWFLRRTRRLLHSFEMRAQDEQPDDNILADQKKHELVERIHDVADKASTPLQRWEHALEQPIALLVLPIFALANAGTVIGMETFTQRLIDPLALGIVLGLVLGKCIGITLATWLALRLGLGELAADMNLRHIVGIGLLAGIGFTMSVFIARLGFVATPDLLITAKTGVLFASLVAGCSGYLWLRWVASRG